MKQYDKSVILPVLGVIALAIGAVFHISIDDSALDKIAEGIAAAITIGVTLYGVIKNHKK